MDRRGFTLVELLATLVILGIIMGIVVITVLGGFDNTKEKTEEAFISTLEDALDIYLDSDAKNLSYSDLVCTINKTHKLGVKIYKTTSSVTFLDVINSEYHPITQSDLVNPANKEKKCKDASEININIYIDEDYVYYYSVNKKDFGCLMTDELITNLPEECLK